MIGKHEAAAPAAAGRKPAALDLSRLFARLGEDMIRRLPELAHIDPRSVLYALSRSRRRGVHGIQARIVPLRFAGGEREKSHRRGLFRETYRMPALTFEGREILYLVYVTFPRFLLLSRREKLLTLLHELFHIAPAGNGDLRRFAGRTYAHGPSRRSYDRVISALLERYLAAGPEERLLAELDLQEADWLEGHLHLQGLSIPLPRPVLVERRML